VTCREAHCFARQAIVVAKHHDASRSCVNRVDRKVAILTDCVVFEKKNWCSMKVCLVVSMRLVVSDGDGEQQESKTRCDSEDDEIRGEKRPDV
jgi:hypothetical protein